MLVKAKIKSELSEIVWLPSFSGRNRHPGSKRLQYPLRFRPRVIITGMCWYTNFHYCRVCYSSQVRCCSQCSSAVYYQGYSCGWWGWSRCSSKLNSKGRFTKRRKALRCVALACVDTHRNATERENRLESYFCVRSLCVEVSDRIFSIFLPLAKFNATQRKAFTSFCEPALRLS